MRPFGPIVRPVAASKTVGSAENVKRRARNEGRCSLRSSEECLRQPSNNGLGEEWSCVRIQDEPTSSDGRKYGHEETAAGGRRLIASEALETPFPISALSKRSGCEITGPQQRAHLPALDNPAAVLQRHIQCLSPGPQSYTACGPLFSRS